MRERTPLPQRMQNAPEVEPGLELYYDAFWELSSCRQLGWSIGPIPWTAINDYAVAYGLDEEQREIMTHCVRALDTVFREHHAPKAGKQWPRAETQSSSRSGWGTGRSK